MGHATRLSKSSVRIDPPPVISGITAAASSLSEKVETRKAVWTLSHGVLRKLPPSASSGAYATAWSAPCSTPHLSLSARATLWKCAGLVTSSSSTSDSPSRLALRCVSTPVMSSFLPSSSIGSPLWPRLARPHRALPMLPTRPGMRLSFPGRRLSCAPRISPPLAEPFDGAGGQLPMRSLSRLPLATIVAAILVLGIAPPAQALPACTDQGLAFYPLATPLRYLDTSQGYTAWWPQTYPLSTQRFQGRVNGIPSGARALVARVTLSNYRGEWPECHWYENAYFEGYFCDYEGEPST